MKYTTH